MEEKKATKEALERRLRNAILHIDKTKDTISVYFDDKGLRLTSNEDVVMIATGAHQHVFNKVCASGISRPYTYTRRFIEIALENDCVVKDAKGAITRSYAKLFELLKNKEDKSEYNLAWYIDKWFFNIFAPLYGIGESEIESFLVYEDYLHNIARQSTILKEKTEDMTNLQFINEVLAQEKSFVEGLDEHVIFPRKTDEERTQEEIAAVEAQMTEQVMEEQANAEQEQQ